MKNKMNNINPNSTTEVNNYIDDMSMISIWDRITKSVVELNEWKQRR